VAIAVIAVIEATAVIAAIGVVRVAATP